MLLRLARRRPGLVCSAGVIGLFVVVGIFGPLFAPQSYRAQDLNHTLLPPLTAHHVLGTDQFGRDMLSRLIYGARASLMVAVAITSASLLAGLVVGLVAGFYGGAIDLALAAVMDSVWSFPIVLIGVVLAAVIGPGLLSVMVAVGVVNWATCGRVVRGLVLSLRNKEFIISARASGCGDVRILVGHVLPNLSAHLLVMASFYMAISITLEAALSFIGLGAQPPFPSWGQMLAEGRQYMRIDQWMVTLPGLAIASVVLALNTFGDSLRDLMD